MVLDLPVLPEGLNPADYWFLQPHGVEWTYILLTLIETAQKGKPKDEGAQGMFVVVTPDGPLWALLKALVPVEALSKATGRSPEKLLGVKLISLTVKERPDLPEPTVDYWGTA